jgi:hypothetical protein
MDYGKATFIENRSFKKTLLVISSVRHPGTVFKFHKKSDKFYACSACKALGKTRIVTVVNGRITGKKHPEDGHHADCRPVRQETIDVLQIDRSMRAEIRKTGKRPREAYAEAVAKIPQMFNSSEQQNGIISIFPTFSEVQRSLYHHRTSQHIPVPDPYNIPEELRTTLRGKSVSSEDANFQERFLLYSGQDGKLLLFCADTELKTLYNSEFIICDGTFEMCPNSSFQLYTLHGFLNGEGLALAWALLPNKTKSTYVELFASIRKAFEDKFNDAGQRRVFVTDFEIAAMESIRQTFPESTLKGCTFHFRQALMRRVADLGLRTEYSSSQSAVVKDWIRQIMGFTLLPVAFIPFAWQMLRHPPNVNDPQIMSKMQAFSVYFENTWLQGSFSPLTWSHFDNAGPRTTNLAEGWHNSLNYSFGIPHPAARHFLHWLQNCQFQIQCREIQLEAGRPPKPQNRVYRDLNERIARAKQQLGLRTGSLFILDPNMGGMLSYEIATYLRHVSYLVAGHSVDEAVC